MSVPLGDQAYRERLPLPAAADHVSCVWIQAVAAGASAYEHRTVPNGCVEIVYRLGAEQVVVVGPQQQPVIERLSPGTTIVGVRLRPGAAPAIVGLPTSELLDLQIEADHAWGRSSVALVERIAAAASPAEAASVLENEARARAAAGGVADSLVAETVRRLQPWRFQGVDEVVSDLYVSGRQLRRRFVPALGYGPKTLHRILRFQGFLAMSHAYGHRRPALGSLAAATGYADQAHLSRECLRLTGLTPTTFLEEMHRMCIGTHDHAASFGELLQALPART